jgi:nitrate/nitrite transporter NarK
VNESSSDEQTGLLSGTRAENVLDLSEVKGSIAGVYSLYGGAGILLLTKLGGYLFDKVSFGAPFYIMATFNAILMVACVLISLLHASWSNQK